jgi:hypothetical protein
MHLAVCCSDPQLALDPFAVDPEGFQIHEIVKTS